MLTVVSFYTLDTPYEVEVQRLLTSCARWGLRHDVRGLPSTGTWVGNCALKAPFLRGLLDEYSDGERLVYVDADASFQAVPELLYELEVDFANHYTPEGQCLSGTIFLRVGDPARELLDRWVELQRQNPDMWDQKVLHLALSQELALLGSELTVYRLPEAYCSIFDREHEVAPVIEHFQASRRHKAVVNGGGS